MRIESLYSLKTAEAIGMVGASFGVEIKGTKGPGQIYTKRTQIGGVVKEEQAEVPDDETFVDLTMNEAVAEFFWGEVEDKLSAGNQQGLIS